MTPTQAAKYLRENFRFETSAQSLRRACNERELAYTLKGNLKGTGKGSPRRDISANGLAAYFKRLNRSVV